MKRLKKIPAGGWIALGFALVALALLILGIGRENGLDSQQEAQRWGGQTVQVSAFLSQTAGYTDDNVLSLRAQVDQTLAAATLEAETENARLWMDAYSAQTTVTAAYGSNTQSVRAIATGGDFFAFHPLDMLSGWYYTSNDVSDTLVVLDENLAWKLFGGTDVAGMAITINGYACTVAGVAKAPKNAVEAAAYGEEDTVYLPYSFLCRMGQTVPLTCYEAVLPEPVSGFGLETVQTALGLGDAEAEMVKNTDRFSFSRCLQVAKAYDTRVQRTGTIYYPFWENAARTMENRWALWAVSLLFWGVYPVVYGVVVSVHGFIRIKNTRRSSHEKAFSRSVGSAFGAMCSRLRKRR
jgi:hypothetical protein